MDGQYKNLYNTLQDGNHCQKMLCDSLCVSSLYLANNFLSSLTDAAKVPIELMTNWTKSRIFISGSPKVRTRKNYHAKWEYKYKSALMDNLNVIKFVHPIQSKKNGETIIFPNQHIRAHSNNIRCWNSTGSRERECEWGERIRKHEDVTRIANAKWVAKFGGAAF